MPCKAQRPAQDEPHLTRADSDREERSVQTAGIAPAAVAELHADGVAEVVGQYPGGAAAHLGVWVVAGVGVGVGTGPGQEHQDAITDARGVARDLALVRADKPEWGGEHLDDRAEPAVGQLHRHVGAVALAVAEGLGPES